MMITYLKITILNSRIKQIIKISNKIKIINLIKINYNNNKNHHR